MEFWPLGNESSSFCRTEWFHIHTKIAFFHLSVWLIGQGGWTGKFCLRSGFDSWHTAQAKKWPWAGNCKILLFKIDEFCFKTWRFYSIFKTSLLNGYFWLFWQFWPKPCGGIQKRLSWTIQALHSQSLHYAIHHLCLFHVEGALPAPEVEGRYLICLTSAVYPGASLCCVNDFSVDLFVTAITTDTLSALPSQATAGGLFTCGAM